MSRHTYYKILYYKNFNLKNVSEEENDNYLDSLEQAIKRCTYLHRKKLIGAQLIIIEISRFENKIVQCLNPPMIFAVLAPTKDAFKNFSKQKKCLNPNSICIHIAKFDDIKDRIFDYYDLLNNWEGIPEHERVLSEIKCRCRSEERALTIQSDYFKLVESEGWQ